MAKSKTQAQKRNEKEARHQEQQKERDEQRELRILQIKKNLEEKQPVVETKILSRKELRKQKKTLDNEPVLETLSTEKIEQKDDIFLVDELYTSNSSDKKESSTYHEGGNTTKIKAEQDAEKERLKTVPTNAAKISHNHSSYCPGLKPVLTRLKKSLTNCTILPGEISQGSNHCEDFELRFQRQTDDNTYKFVARSGYTSQDVFISVSDNEAFTEEVILESVKTAIENNTSRQDDQTSNDISFGYYNRFLHHERQSFWKEGHQKQYLATKEREAEIKQQKKIKEHSRKLATKGIDSNLIDEYAERDVDIITGKNRTKNSMQ